MEYLNAFALLLLSFFCREISSNDILTSPLSREYPQGKSELVFLLDRSGSIGAANFETEKVFVENLVAHFTIAPDATRVSVISYSEDVVRHIDYLRNPKNKCFFTEDIQGVQYANAGQTNTKGALEEARNVLVNARPAVNKAVILLSDGLSNVGGNAIPTASLIKQDGVEIFTIGVGLFNKEELNSIASSPLHTFEYSGFAEFRKLALRIRGDPHEVRWDTTVTTDTCNNLCSNPTLSFGCCDIDAKCTCALVGGLYDCVCGPGYYGNNGLMGQCTECPRGTYKSTYEPAPSCTPCPDNSNTDRTRSTAVTDCHCNEGYEGNPGQGEPCIVKTCPKLRAPLNGKMTPHICNDAFNSQCRFSCNRGYQLLDPRSNMRRCLATGEWSASEAICRRAQCPNLPAPANGVKQCDSGDEFGAVCEFTCNRGFVLAGSTHRKCTEGGTWSGTETTCTGHKCPVLRSPANGGVNPKHCAKRKQDFKRICVFTCDDGYKLVGPSYRICDSSGQWTGGDVQNTCVDNSPPEITCPNGIKQNTDSGLDSALVQWPSPEVSDNSGDALTVTVEPAGLESPHRFQIGAHAIKYTLTDSSGLNTSCTFHIVIIDNESPKVVECPENIDQQSRDRKTSMNWPDPVFTDNSETVRISRSHSPGVELTWGTHQIRYTAEDPSGNEAVCQFQIKVYPTSCPPYPEPVNGARSCDDWLFGMFCRISCNKKYEFAKVPADWYICDANGDWKTQPPGRDIPWPDCSLLRNPKKVQKGLKSQYYAGNCNNPKTQKMIKKAFIDEFVNSFFGQNGACLHGNNACTIKAVTVYCGAIDHTVGRKRRDVNDAVYNNVVTIEFTIEGEMTGPSEDDDVEEEKLNVIMNALDEVAGQFEHQARSGSMVLTVDDNVLVINEDSFEASATIPVCGNGTVQKDRKCVNCPVGTYYDVTSDTCELCSPGYYQDEEAQLECQKCDEGTSTSGLQAKNFTECIDICKPGTYSLTGLATCKSCPKGTYQPDEKQTACIPCPPSTTTAVEGATSSEQCGAQCSVGMFSPSGVEPCSPCPVGFYQPDRSQRKCLECQDPKTTYGIGTTSDDHCIEIDHCASGPCYNNGVCTTDRFTHHCECLDGYTGSDCENEVDECLSNPCAFNATCLDRDNGFQCVCSPGYTGQLCDVEINECETIYCLNGGQCEDEVDGFQCVCNNGHSGQFCEIPPDHCADNPCQNGGLCGQGGESAVCSCPSGFSGLFCEIDVNECQSNPCMNGAICEDGEDSYQCNCAEGFAGHDCEVNINDCLHEQCQNGASCVDLIDGFMCQCPPSYTGQHCERELSSDFNIVFRRRVTTDYATLDRYTLPDMEAFTIGFWLRTDSDSGTVLSYATTVDGTTQDNAIVVGFFGDFKFQLSGETVYVDLTIDDGTWHYVVVTWTNQDGELKFYFDGVLASQRQHLQEGAVIPGGGVLILGQEQDELGGGFSPPESLVADLSRLNIWSFVLSELDIMQLSSHCEDKIGDLAAWPDFVLNRMAEVELVSPSNFCSDVDQCLPNPCENGGTCHDSVNDFVCECPSGYAGDTCTQRALHCNPDVCNNGRCRDQGDSYVCDCHIGFTGDHCEVEINECQSQPCQNGGTCTDNIGNFVCQCSTGYNGSQCENEIICDTPPTAQHSDAWIQPGDFVVGTRVRYFCQQGYAPSTPTMTLTCDNNGQWSGDHPSCHDIGECAYGTADCQHSCFNFDGGYRCDCYPGYQLNTDKRTCLDLDRCSLVTDVQRPCQHICSHVPGGFRCFCQIGFSLTDNGRDCKDIDECASGEHECQQVCRNSLGSYVCECHPGFVLDEDGKHCKAVTCVSPTSPSNGMVYSVFNNYVYGSRVMVQCYPGHKLVGPMFRSCDQTGLWSGMTPYCKEINCGPIGTLENGDVTATGSKMGDAITFTCNQGFRLVDTEFQECEENGKWSGTRPYCQPII